MSLVLVTVTLNVLSLGNLDKDSVEGESTNNLAPRKFKNKLEEALTAKQEMEAKVTTLEAKVKMYEAENAELKQKVLEFSHISFNMQV